MRSILHLPRSSLLTRTAAPYAATARSSLLTRTAAPSAATARVTLPIPRRRSFTRSLATPSTSGYGDADQTGESAYPQRAGSRPRNDTEHPGREPVNEGKGTGSGTAETGSSKHSTKSYGKGYGEAISDGHKGDSPGGKSWSEYMDDLAEGERAEVEKHNREMDKRYDHKKTGPDEKVGKGYWNGE